MLWNFSFKGTNKKITAEKSSPKCQHCLGYLLPPPLFPEMVWALKSNQNGEILPNLVTLFGLFFNPSPMLCRI
jgi:hypothetical protein